MWDRARDYRDSALQAIGLEPRRTVTDLLLPALGLFSLGVVVGAGLGLMFAPKPGTELRGDVRRGLGTVRSRLRRRSNGVGDNHDLDGASDDERDSITVVPTTQA
jgi:hypothetical protein